MTIGTEETSPVLLFHGKAMDPRPVNLPMQMMEMRLASFQPVRVVLEPGDMTRYELVVLLMQGYGYFVARVETGTDAVRGVYLADNYAVSELAPLGSNPWTMQIFDWWLHVALGLAPRVAETSDDAGAS